jgi:signal transduction histidine kinase
MHDTPAQMSTFQDTDLQAILAAWNTATERLQQTHELLHAEVKRLTDELAAKNAELEKRNRLADLGQMAGHVAHEVRNGLVPVKLYVSLLRRRLGGDAASLDLLDKTRGGFELLENLVNDLLQFTAQREPVLAFFHPHELCEELCDALWPQWESRGIEVVLDFPEDLCVRGDRDMLRRALLNLLLNALDVLPERGRLTVAGRVQGEEYELVVTDTGPGIDPDKLPQLFAPYFTTKASGTGLGLAIVERIAELHGGSVAAANGAEGGAEFHFRWPAQPVPARREMAANLRSAA